MSRSPEEEQDKAKSPDSSHVSDFCNKPEPPDPQTDETFVEADECSQSLEFQHFPSPSDIYDVQMEMEKLHLQDDVKKAPSSFSPEQTGGTYRFRCPGRGVFKCTSTGLVFVMAKEAELKYTVVQWDVSLLQSACKKSTGHLFDIECSEEAVYQLHLPHREPKEELFAYDLLSVAHFTGAALNFLKPLKITDTHVVVDVPHLSAFGLVLDFSKSINGQVLLFLRPPNKKYQVLDVILLPHDIPLSEVAVQQGDAEYIKISSDCRLYCDQSYSVLCKPEGFHIQPEDAKFTLKDGTNFYPTFEVFLTSDPEEVTLIILDKDKKEVWKRLVYLSGSSRETPQNTVQVLESVPVQVTETVQMFLTSQQKLSSVRTQLIKRVTEPNLNSLMDELLDQKVISKPEKESLGTKNRREKAEGLIDMVLGKGNKASSKLIDALRELDPYLFLDLKLHSNETEVYFGD